MKKLNIICVGIVVLLLVLAGCDKQEEIKSEDIKDKSLLDIQERGELIIATISDYPPMEYLDEEGNLIGYDIDVVKEIASQIGVTAKIEKKLWGELFDLVKSGEVDIIISSITITPERQNEMLFSAPYFDAGQSIIVRAENNEVKGIADLKTRKVGVQAGTTCETATLEHVDSSLVMTYESYDPIINDVKNGKVDALVTDLIGSIAFVKENPELKIVGEPFTQEYYGIATKIGNKELMDEINRILREMKRNGKLNEIKEKWM